MKLTKTTQRQLFPYAILVTFLIFSSCKTQQNIIGERESKKVDVTEKKHVVNEKPTDVESKSTSDVAFEKKEISPLKTSTTNVYDPNFLTEDRVVMERVYVGMLKPIYGMKKNNPEIYWFIVSWLNTHYDTPNWDNHNSAQWRIDTKKNGIDCSGFARVMESEVFNREIRGGSRMILDTYCTRIDRSNLTMGDLVFFQQSIRQAGVEPKVDHVGVYLTDGYFVHATSTKSAKKGKGLNISSLDEKYWLKTFTTGGKIKK